MADELKASDNGRGGKSVALGEKVIGTVHKLGVTDQWEAVLQDEPNKNVIAGTRHSEQEAVDLLKQAHEESWTREGGR